MNPYNHNQKNELQTNAEIEGKRIAQEETHQNEAVSQFAREEKRVIEEKLTARFEEDLHRTVPSSGKTAHGSAAASTSSLVPFVKSEFLLQVENILADGLGDMYVKMEPTLRARFKQKGEEIAGKVEEIVAQGKVRIKLILELIRGWLRMIPGVNKFFLEQEAKIKADKIASMVL